jgi:hypothetical protein
LLCGPVGNANEVFRNTNQSHSCAPVSKKDFFADRPVVLKKLYNKIIVELEKLGDYREEPV